MFFFRVTLASFDDEKKVLFMFPEQQALDENGVPPFSEKLLCLNSVFKQFVKDTKTSIVDVSYELYQTSAAVTPDNLNDEQFEQLARDNKVTKLENNDISIMTNKQKSSSGSSKYLGMYIVIVGMVLFVIVLAVLSMSGKSDEKDDSSETSSITEISSDISSIS